MIIFQPNGKHMDTWNVSDTKVPLKIWSTPDEYLAQGVGLSRQADELANHPLAFHHVALMPDFHLGYGMPIGGVMACERGIIPNAVGNDIGCGMTAIKTTVASGHLSRTDLQKIRLAIHGRVPVGEARHKNPQVLPRHIYDLEKNALDMALLAGNLGCIVPNNLNVARSQLGTLGGGNHFIELQTDEEGYLWVMIHSGSRGIGGKICQYYSAEAKRLNAEWFSDIPSPDLAFFPILSPQGVMYRYEMEWAMAFAEANRRELLTQVLLAYEEVMGVPLAGITRIDTHHNYAQQEHHFGKDPWVHRKGAVKAYGPVIIPGSMGTASYICEGLNNPDSFGSCSHGGGRVMSRTEANNTITHEQAVKSMKGVVFGIKNGSYDEMPMAYKDIDTVIARQGDLVRPLHKLTPLAVVKG